MGICKCSKLVKLNSDYYDDDSSANINHYTDSKSFDNNQNPYKKEMKKKLSLSTKKLNNNIIKKRRNTLNVDELMKRITTNTSTRTSISIKSNKANEISPEKIIHKVKSFKEFEKECNCLRNSKSLLHRNSIKYIIILYN